ncbi:exopolysaccharide biosynthesis polyprenyl glycosylphosphotransferase [Candidatus Parcubacteria bacterium]|nr:exopolysaccharide biosynthesis polyprenyl glycosylphosphotransferase [Candidatus Parcubacteria bacterium]
MNLLDRKSPLILLVGDIFFFLLSLWITLFLRSFSFPSGALFSAHLVPFGLLFVVWVVVFYIAGLYERHTLLLTSTLPGVLFNTLVANSIIAVLFFYFIPLFGIAPKTILFIYLIVSFIIILLWRTYGYFLLGTKEAEKAIIIGSGEEMKELVDEVNGNPLYNLRFVDSIDLNRTNAGIWDEIVSRIYADNISLIAIDLTHEKVEPVLPHLYNLIFSKVRFIDMHKIYEDIFNRVPLSLLRYNWFLENISTSPRAAYDALKRIMDILLSFLLAIGSLVLYPFVYVAIKLDDKGPLFSHQKRVGQNNKIVEIIKFRTMTIADDQGKWTNDKTPENKVTRVGKFLRNSRIDELPQLWNVLRGDISLIGPRPEFPDPVKHYTAQIPYYNVRHIIKPGLSGWAQIYGEHPHHEADVSMTKNKLSYDLYYIKNRSLLLDLKIALRTIKTLLSRAGV